MFTLCLSALLFAAPIPKVADEGTIALFLLNGKKTELLLLDPNGKEKKRLDLSGIEGSPYTVKLLHDGNRALVRTSETNGTYGDLGRATLTPEWIYLVTLDGSEKPKEMFKDKHYFVCLPNRNGSKLFISELDQEKMVKARPNEMFFKSWIQDLKTGKVEPVPLPSEYRFVDISADDSTILLNSIINDNEQAATTSTKTWKPVPIKNGETRAMGLSRDGKQAFLCQDLGVPQRLSFRHCLCDLKSGERLGVTLPENMSWIRLMAFNKDGKRIAYFLRTTETFEPPFQFEFQVYISNPDGKNKQMIYSTTTEIIKDIDWR